MHTEYKKIIKFLNLNITNNDKISLLLFIKMLNQIKKSKKIFNLFNNFTVDQTRKVTTNESLVNYLKMKINMKGQTLNIEKILILLKKI